LSEQLIAFLLGHPIGSFRVKLHVTAQRGIDTIAIRIGLKCGLLFGRRSHNRLQKNLRLA
jgi:hypothetical protein